LKRKPVKKLKTVAVIILYNSVIIGDIADLNSNEKHNLLIAQRLPAMIFK